MESLALVLQNTEEERTYLFKISVKLPTCVIQNAWTVTLTLTILVDFICRIWSETVTRS